MLPLKFFIDGIHSLMALAVPFWFFCSTNIIFSLDKALIINSFLYTITTIILSGFNVFATLVTYNSMGLLLIRCSTFGKLDCIRVPLPAAKIIIMVLVSISFI